LELVLEAALEAALSSERTDETSRLVEVAPAAALRSDEWMAVQVRADAWPSKVRARRAVSVGETDAHW
jgi:hypothetical protein